MSSLGSLGAECRAGAGDRGGASGVAARGRHSVPAGGRARGGARAEAPPASACGRGMATWAPSPPPHPGMLSGGSFYYGYLI